MHRFTINSSNNHQIECKLDMPNTQSKLCNGLALILHPHPLFGGTMDNKVVQTMVRSVTDLDYIALRFNFRGVGHSTGEHDHGISETQDALDVMQYMIQNISTNIKGQGYILAEDCPIILGGFSFGSFVAANLFNLLQTQTHYLPLQQRIKKMLMIGTAAGKWNIPSVPNNSIIIHGDEDEVIPLLDTMLWAKKNDLTIMIVPGCGHFFHGKLLILKELIKQNLI
jgi:uncharacterized protein